LSLPQPKTSATGDGGGGGPRRLSLVAAETTKSLKKRGLSDRVARWVVTIGGLGIIASILAILVFITVEVVPLARPARVRVLDERRLGTFPAAVVVGDEHRSHVVTLGSDGIARAIRVEDGVVVGETPIAPPPAATAPGTAEGSATEAPETGPPGELPALAFFDQPSNSTLLAAASDEGWAVLVPVDFEVSFGEDDVRTTEPVVGEPLWIRISEEPRPVRAFAARTTDEGGASVAVQFESGEVEFISREVETNMFSGEETETLARDARPIEQRLTRLEIDRGQRNLYGASDGGELLWWTVGDGELEDAKIASGSPAEITALEVLLGDKSVIVGHADGTLSQWSQVRRDGGDFEMVRIREFPRHQAPIRIIRTSPRGKSFLVSDGADRMTLYNATSERTLWSAGSPLAGTQGAVFSPKADGAFLIADGRLAALDIDNPHPEISLQTLFGKVWYEGADEPDYVWQSTGATDGFESKMSLVPLLVGTLKGTLYSLLLAVPLGVFGAMYASQFMHPRLLRYVKPVVEVMAALPSVVLGFLAGLWLAPRLERYFPALIMLLLALPLFMLLAGFLWTSVPPRIRSRAPVGSQLVFFCTVLALGCWLCLALSHPVEVAVFGGSFQGWLNDTFSLPYDQRNAVVIGLAMGFAVIPIIFAISEDAFSNVPKNLIAGSLALGANRWETVTRVVLPSASPGIFSAIMVGFGRAVGETMIVLMATGNTPIMDWNPFNGFRTLSANIAVEIPEAPQYGTLYRVLFLAALLLFIVTFVVNTAAELIRIRLRKKYQEL
jgi:phosphate transport system permease protein